MINMPLTTDKLQVVTSSGADLDIHVDYIDITVATGVVSAADKTNTQVTATANTFDILAAGAGGGVTRFAKCINVRNIDAAVSQDVTVQFNANGTLITLYKATLLAGESLTYNEDGTWFHYDINGGVYGAGQTIAAQADQETATSTILVVTPGRQHFHPSAAKFWVIFTGNSTTITASYNMTSITDGATQATVTIATDFSGSAWCVVATAVAAAVSAAGARLASCLTMAAGSIIVFCMDAQATPALADPTSWCVCGFGDQ
jgi:hypothetical protein